MKEKSVIWTPEFSGANQVVTNAVQPRGLHGVPAVQTHFYEYPSFDRARIEAWSYTDSMSYSPGEMLNIHTWSSAAEYGIVIYKDGLKTTEVYKSPLLQGEMHETTENSYAFGCGWPVSHSIKIPEEWPSGVYILQTVVDIPGSLPLKQEHFFVVKAPSNKKSDMLFVLATATYAAYNAWGGANHYEGISGPNNNLYSPILSMQRPWERGFVCLPEGAPRIVHRERPEPGFRVRNDDINWAYSLGYSKQYASAGWAIYDRHFALWAEANGYHLDYATQHDLHYQKDLLDAYSVLITAGHDEYWSMEMRDAADSFVDSGGNAAYLGANFLWQIRLESEGEQQVCYKWYFEQDPLYETSEQQLTTTVWEHEAVNHPAAKTRGVSGAYGVFAHYGGASPRASGGYTVFRENSWVFEGTDLYFGDVFGHEAGIFGFEVDGVDFTFTDGLPVPTYEDGAPESVEILAMSPASVAETVKHTDAPHLSGDDESFMASVRFGQDSAENRKRVSHNAGMMVTFKRGAGEVFSSGTTDWVYGLKHRDYFTETITKNVLNRFAKK